MTHRKLLTGLISLGSGLVGPSRQGTYRKLTNFETANYIVPQRIIQLANTDNSKKLFYGDSKFHIQSKVLVKTNRLTVDKLKR